MSNDYLFHAGEATVLAADGQFTDAMPEILIGRTSGPVGQAFAAMMAQSKGHTAMFAIRACNQLVRPATITVPKVTLKDAANIDLFGGVVQSATADAVVDCLIEGVIPKRWPTSCASSAWCGSTRAARRIRTSTRRTCTAPTTRRPSWPSSGR
jgi:5,6,7,8-tetrahydromethanopterin hydro-lyase